MSCERYKKRLVDLAADVASAASDPELDAHLNTCASCRAELETQRALFAAIDRGVAEMVAGEPPGDFAAHVRQRIAEEAIEPRPWFAGWVPITAAALALIVLLTFWVTRRQPAAPEQAGDKTPPAQIGRPPREPQSAQNVPSESAPARTSGPRTIRPPREPQMAANREPEVLVPRGETLAIARLLNANWSGKADGASLTAQAPPVRETLKPMTIEELKIPALEVFPLESGEPPKGSREK